MSRSRKVSEVQQPPEATSNGASPVPSRPSRRRAPRANPADPAAPPVAVEELAGVVRDELPGVLRYTSADQLDVRWFWPGWIGHGIYTLLVGEPGCGKSTMLAHLCGRAARCVIMPGEEDIRRVVLPRLLEAGVDLRGVSFVPSSDGWHLPAGKTRLIEHIHRERAGLVIIDPLDSYMSRDSDENANLSVRRMLEALLEAAEATQAAVVAVRHPGKAAGNLLAGSRAWRSHPRAILKMVLSTEDDRRGIMSVVKPPFGRQTPPHWYSIHGLEGRPKRWTLDEEAPIYAEREAAEIPDRIDRTKIHEAVQLLTGLLSGGEEMDARVVYSACEKYQLKERTVRYAADRLGVTRRHEGLREDRRVYWRLPPETAP